ncbi:MAG TPA: hypothetical protein VI957_02045 [Candidatus Paceibacterota bacterium]
MPVSFEEAKKFEGREVFLETTDPVQGKYVIGFLNKFFDSSVILISSEKGDNSGRVLNLKHVNTISASLVAGEKKTYYPYHSRR